MGARVSQAMIEAMKLIKAGKTAYEAARITGLDRSAISKSRLYREYKATVKGDKL